MNTPYRIVHVEDSPDDAELVMLALRQLPCRLARVDTAQEYLAQIEESLPDVILCDYQMPRFTAEQALALLAARGLDVPFIIVSSHIGESAAVIAMQQGASDYLAKSALERLPKAIESAIERRDARREKARAMEALRRSETIRRGILDSLLSRIALLDGAGVVQACNKAWDDFDTSRTRMGVPTPRPGENYFTALDQAFARGNPFARDLVAGIRSVGARESKAFTMQYPLDVASVPHWLEARVMPLEGSERGVVVSHRDVTDRVSANLALRDAHGRLQGLSSRMLMVQEEERRTLSRDLHDDIGQTLGALKIGLHRLLPGTGAGQAEILADCLAAAESALARVRELAQDLRPPQLEQPGLEEALRWLVDRQAAATGTEITFKCAGLAHRRAPAALEAACYRIAQEGLNNATRHARATQIVVSVQAEANLLKVAIRDNGVGFDEAAALGPGRKAESLGLISMEERAHLAGGRLKVRSSPGGGTTVNAVFPLAAAQQAAAAEADAWAA